MNARPGEFAAFAGLLLLVDEVPGSWSPGVWCRSVSSLAAFAFAGAMIGRQILGAVPVKRRALLLRCRGVAGHSHLERRPVAEAFRSGAWRILALDAADSADRRLDRAATHTTDGDDLPPGLVWELHSGYHLRPESRIVPAATRQCLAELTRSLSPPAPR